MKIGIDLGGSHIAIGVVSDNSIIEKFETDINLKDNIKEFIEETIVKQVSKFYEKYDINGIGIAVPGVVKNQKITNLFNLGIGEYDIIARLNELGILNAKIENDGVCAAIAEMKLGSLQSYNKSLFICLGTGIGGAVCENNVAIPSNEKIGFEFGHMQLQKEEKRLCKCGCINCFETYGSIKTLKKDLQKELNLESIFGKELHDEIIKKIDNLSVKKIINNYLDEIVYGISNISNIIKPEAICLGGGFTYYADILFDRFVQKFLKGENLDNSYKIPKIVKAKFENDAGIIGASLLD